jgi:hypothetical protein
MAGPGFTLSRLNCGKSTERDANHSNTSPHRPKTIAAKAIIYCHYGGLSQLTRMQNFTPSFTTAIHARTGVKHEHRKIEPRAAVHRR